MSTTAITFQTIIVTPLGKVGIRMLGEAIDALDYVPADTVERLPSDAATEVAVAQLMAYFRDPRAPLTVPLAPAGTAFRQRVWSALRAIPLGTVLSYGELAAQLGTAARAVGGACRNNPISILIPCHRVVARHGLGGYAGEVDGDLLAIKRWLLQHEGVVVAS